MAELSPGSVDRRYVQDIGERKHRERIHKASKFADDHKKLPFSFSKPKKTLSNNILVECSECGSTVYCNKNTYMIICNGCKKVTKV